MVREENKTRELDASCRRATNASRGTGVLDFTSSRLSDWVCWSSFVRCSHLQLCLVARKVLDILYQLWCDCRHVWVPLNTA